MEVLRLIPTKDHLDREKLDAVLRWFDPEDLSILEPLKVASDEQQNLYLLDGHCRAWALWATGVEKAPVVVSSSPLKSRQSLGVMDITGLPVF